MPIYYAMRILTAAVLCSALLCSCQGKPSADFTWLDSDGKSRVFSTSTRMMNVQNGNSQNDKLKTRIDLYSLVEPIMIYQGQALAVDIEGITATSSKNSVSASNNTIVLSVSEKSDGKSPVMDASFAVEQPSVRFYLRIRPGTRLASLSVRSIDARSFNIRGISIQPVFAGIEERGGRLSVSSGFKLSTGSGTRTAVLDDPFAGIEALDQSQRNHSSALFIHYDTMSPGPSQNAEIVLSSRAYDSTERKLRLALSPQTASTLIGREFFGAETRSITAVLPGNLDLRALCVKAIDTAEYEHADLGRVLAAGALQEGKDYSQFVWDIFPSVLVLVFKDYKTQDRYLKRLAFYVEKAGYRGELHYDEEIANLHGWNAHDYRPEDLAAFFDTARKKQFPLSSEEWALESLLAEHGILNISDGKVSSGTGALISVSMETPFALRKTLLVHESLHAIFFVDAEYRDFVKKTWAAIDNDEKWFWKTYFGWAAYDTGDEYLMANEFQAYLLQQPLSAVRDYFTKRKTDELLLSKPLLREKLDAYMSKYASTFERHARVLDAYLKDTYGLEAGRTYRLIVEK